MDPAAFAAELISRLEKLQLELESRHSLEARLQQIREVALALALPRPRRAPPRPGVPRLTPRPLCRLHRQDEEKEGSDLAPGSQDAAPPQHPLSLLPSGSYEEDPQTILDDHLSRVLKTPGCQSPGVGRYSPRSRSPDRHHHHQHQQQQQQHPHPLLPPGGRLPPAAAAASLAGCPLLGAKGFVTKQTTKHVHHHYIHHHAVPKTQEELEAEAAQRVRCFCPGGPEYYCYSRCKSHPRAPEPGPADQFG